MHANEGSARSLAQRRPGYVIKGARAQSSSRLFAKPPRGGTSARRSQCLEGLSEEGGAAQKETYETLTRGNGKSSPRRPRG